MTRETGSPLRRRLEGLQGRLRSWARSFDFTLARRFGLATRADRRFLVLIVVTGVVAGILGITLHGLIDGMQALLWGSGGSLLERARLAPWWVVIGAPAVGGLLIGLIFHWGRLAGKPGGMSVLIEAVALSGGRVPGRPILVHALAAVATVGSGGSLGREGPMIRLGAMVSSRLASHLGVEPHRVKVLVGCGAAAGLAAVYNIPIGGALFAMEVILGNFALEIFGPLVASSVISTVIARSVQGDLPRFPVEGVALTSFWELFSFAGLGLVGAVSAVVFVLGVRSGKAAFSRLTLVPRWLHPVIGMALLGVLALELPYVLEGGSDTILEVLHGGVPLTVLLALPVAKVLAVALTRGGGGSGGLFTPSLFFGAAIGALYGTAMGVLFPGAVASPAAYAAVGMAALSAGTSHAPISAILILFEFTGNYDLILPLMAAAIVASLVSSRIYPYSIYTESLERRGVDLSSRMGEVVLAGLDVEDMVRADPQVLHPATPYRKVVEAFLTARRHRLFVVDDEGMLLGAVSLHDLKDTLGRSESIPAVVAHDLTVPVELVVHRDERLHQAAEAFSRSDYERLPVVDGEGRFLGLLAKRDLLAVYAQEVLGRPALLATFVSGEESGASRDYVELPPDFTVQLVAVPERLVGRTVEEVRLPQTVGVRILEIKRPTAMGKVKRHIPEATTRFEAGDELIVMGPTRAVEALGKGAAAEADEAQALRRID